MATNLKELLGLSPIEKGRLKKEQLLEILNAASVDDAENLGGTSLAALTSTLTGLVTEISNLRQAYEADKASNATVISNLTTQVQTQGEVIAKQQVFLEHMDRKYRERNVILLGVPEASESLDGATDDNEKVKKVWDAAGITCNINSIKRLGNSAGSRRRPILAVVDSKAERHHTGER